MKKILNCIFMLLVVFMSSSYALASFDEYMYYQQLEAHQNNGIAAREVTGSKYVTFKEKTKEGTLEHKFNKNNYKKVSVTDYDRTGQIRRIKEFYELVDVKVQNDNVITIDMYISNDRNEKHTNIAFDSNDNLPAYLLANEYNKLVKFDKDMTLNGSSVTVYKNNKPLKLFLVLSDDFNRKCEICLDYTTGKLLTEKEYFKLH